VVAETRNRYRLRFAKLSEVLPLQRASLGSVRMTDRRALLASVRMTDRASLIRFGRDDGFWMRLFEIWPLVQHRPFGAGWYRFGCGVGGRLGCVAVAQGVADYFVNGVDEDHF
jgi:hypothetical protein